MRLQIRAFVVAALAIALLALFLRNVDLWRVAGDISRAQPAWLALSLATALGSLVVRTIRWQYLLLPLGDASFGNAFRATAVGYAASSILPARAGEVIRPYFLSRHEPMSATGAFATIILERLLDMITVLVLLAVFVIFFGRGVAAVNPGAFRALQWAGSLAAVVAAAAVGLLFVVAGRPARVGALIARLERIVPRRFAAAVGRLAEKFAKGLGAIRRPGQLLAALALSFPLWLCIGTGIWAVAVAFGIGVPFSGSFLLIAILVVGVAVPTPGAVGGFDAAFLFAVTAFYQAPREAGVGAAIVLHLFSMLPTLVLGLFFAAQEGLNVSTMRRLADQAEKA
jgi:uncharacterized protein (TIRG00374 family)